MADSLSVSSVYLTTFSGAAAPTLSVSSVYLTTFSTAAATGGFMGYINGSVKLKAEIIESNQADDGVAVLKHLADYYTAIGHGDDPGQSMLVYGDSNTVTAGSAVNYDLAGSLESELDASAVVFSEVRGLVIRNRSTVLDDDLVVTGSSFVSAVDGELVVKPGGLAILVAPLYGYTVTAATADVLTIDGPVGSNVDFDLLVWGI